jgi:Tol biopolymer transport system component
MIRFWSRVMFSLMILAALIPAIPIIWGRTQTQEGSVFYGYMVDDFNWQLHNHDLLTQISFVYPPLIGITSCSNGWSENWFYYRDQNSRGEVMIFDNFYTPELHILSNVHSWVVLSPDESRVAFIRDEGLVIYNLNNRQEQQFTLSPAIYPEFWLDDQTVVLLNRYYGNNHLQYLNLETEQMQLDLQFPPNSVIISVAPDGEWIIVREGGQTPSTLFAQHVDTGERVGIGEALQSNSGPEWSHDGRRLAFFNTTHHLIVWDSETRTLESVALPNTGAMLSWSPSGAQIGILTAEIGGQLGEIYQVHLYDFSSGALTTIWDRWENEQGALLWWHSDNYLLLNGSLDQTDDYEVYLYDIVRGIRQALTGGHANAPGCG